MKLIYFAQEVWEKEYMERKLPGVEITCVEGTLQEHPEISDPDAGALSVFVNSRVGAAELDRFPKLRLIATRSTGFDHIDLGETKKRGIEVASVPSYVVNTVAEFAFGLLLALSRKICDAHARVRGGSFSQEGLTGFDLAGKTIGIIGCGHIGIHSVGIANGFGMKVLVYDVHQDPELAKNYRFAYAPLKELLGTSDVINIHVPYNEHTHHLINAQNISLIKRGAYLINTARGAVVETDALVQALRQGILAGAGLDVLEEEGDMQEDAHLLASVHPKAGELKTVLENHYLMEHPRVVVTPHVAFDTAEAIARILDTTAENILKFKS